MSIKRLPLQTFFKQLYSNNNYKLLLQFRSFQSQVTHATKFVQAARPHTNGGNSKQTVGEILKKWKEEFKEHDISEPCESAEHILAYVLGTSKIPDVYRQTERVLEADDIFKMDNLCRKRLDRMPVQYVIQEWDFRDLTLKMSRPVFIPRPETEMLVDIVLNEIDKKRTGTIMELCCGSGAISLALLKARSWLNALAVDKSECACNLTKVNADITNLSDRVRIIHKEVDDNFSLNSNETFDIIVSNPPYIPAKDMVHLQTEIKLYEDPEALNGGDDGLTVIKSILKVGSCLLNYRGKLFLEVDPSHPALIKSWLQENDSLGMKCSGLYNDFCDKERFVEIIKEK